MTTSPPVVRVRFAPSPTGHLHVGGARTALFNWLFARHHGGKFILRIEDTDQARSTLESEAMVLDDLQWLGLDWDEGPLRGGPHAPYRQSERMSLYARVASDLLARHRAYRCFCPEELLEQKRMIAEAEAKPPHYDLTCLHLSDSDVETKLDDKVPHVIRFHVPKTAAAAFDGDVTIHDRIRGEVTWKKESLGDFIVLRSDGMPTYNFSVVVDDHDMEITHVIRAEEHLTNTHRQVLIYRAMEWPVPEFAHVSLILGADRTKLSKRHGATSVSAFADEGYLSDAMFNFLALLGWSAPGGEERFSREFATREFSLDRVNSAPAVFDEQKFQWLNGQYIHGTPAPQIYEWLRDRFRELNWLVEESAVTRAWLEEAIDLVKKGCSRLSDFAPALLFFFEFDEERVVTSEGTRAALADEPAKSLLAKLTDELRVATPRDSDEYHAMADRLKSATGLKGKGLFMPIRAAIMGSGHGPELHRAIPLLQRGSELRGLAAILSPLERVERVQAILSRAQ